MQTNGLVRVRVGRHPRKSLYIVPGENGRLALSDGTSVENYRVSETGGWRREPVVKPEYLTQ